MVIWKECKIYTMLNDILNNKKSLNRIFSIIVKYCVPMLSVGFLIATVRYTAYLESQNTYSNNEVLTVTQIKNPEISSMRVVSDEDLEKYPFPSFSFNSIEDKVRAMGKKVETVQEIEPIVTTTAITTTTDTELSTTTTITEKSQEMCHGYGVFVDGEFLGAVLDTTQIQNALNNILHEYLNMDNVTEAHFSEEITYDEGSYAMQYMLEPTIIIDTLLGNAKEDIYYTIEDGDSLSLVAELSEISIQELLELNPEITNPNVCHSGQRILVQKYEPFLNVEYTEVTSKESEIPFETITQEDDTLLLGESIILTNGEKGVLKTVTEVKYLNGVEVSSITKEPQTIREPISQVVAVGTAEPITTTNIEVTQEDVAVINNNVVDNSIELGVGEFISPIEVGLGYISDRFISNRNHKGLDIASPYGTPIRASAEGVVISAGWNNGGYGYFVMLDHGNGYTTLYAHMSEVLVSEGECVSVGETIGRVGSTGNSTGNHLHFEVRHNNVCVNPEDYLIETI